MRCCKKIQNAVGKMLQALCVLFLPKPAARENCGADVSLQGGNFVHWITGSGMPACRCEPAMRNMKVLVRICTKPVCENSFRKLQYCASLYSSTECWCPDGVWDTSPMGSWRKMDSEKCSVTNRPESCVVVQREGWGCWAPTGSVPPSWVSSLFSSLSLPFLWFPSRSALWPDNMWSVSSRRCWRKDWRNKWVPISIQRSLIQTQALCCLMKRKSCKSLCQAA